MAYALALLSSLLWGSADAGGGLLTRRLPAVAVVGWSQAAGLVAIVAAVLVRGETAPVGQWLPWAVAAGLVGSVGLMAFYVALASGTMGVVSPIAALGVVVPVAVGLLGGDRPGIWQVLGILLAVSGAVLASGPELHGGAGARPVLLAALAGMAFGTVFVLVSRGAESSSLLTLTGMRGTSVTCFGLAALARRSLGGVRRHDLPALAVVGVGDVAANLCFAVASTQGLVSLVAVLGSVYPVVTVLIARAVLHERMTGVQNAGCVTALAGVVLVAGGG